MTRSSQFSLNFVSNANLPEFLSLHRGRSSSTMQPGVWAPKGVTPHLVLRSPWAPASLPLVFSSCVDCGQVPQDLVFSKPILESRYWSRKEPANEKVIK